MSAKLFKSHTTVRAPLLGNPTPDCPPRPSREFVSERRTVYVASSWRNRTLQQKVVAALREAGHEVYDFTDPANDKGAFSWNDLGEGDGIRPEDWPAERCIEFLRHPRAEEGFRQDFDAMQRSAACVLVLPAGRSANLEAGWFVGKGRPLVVLKDAGTPDLMYKMASAVVARVEEIAPALRKVLV